VTWERLDNTTGRVLGKLDLARPDLSPTLSVLETGVPRQRRFLVMVDKAKATINWVWVDDDGTCLAMDGNRADAGRPLAEGIGQTLWHTYQVRPTWHGEPRREMPYRFLAVRCPSSLTLLEWGQIEKDDVDGKLRQTLRKRQAALVDEKRGRRKPEPDRRPSWDDEGD
jgi:hypothetical protein